jgi:2-polyprenyl-3-methyl-5-hydroxy-6-metoxy-1,4-benzoquinol methylase
MTEEFDKFADSYRSQLDKSVELAGESSSYFVEYKAAYIARTLGTDTPTKILDFGCGVGILSIALAEHRPKDVLHGYDVSAESLDRIPANVRQRGRFTSQLDELDRDYDLIVISNVLHHIAPEKRQATISDLSTRLSPRGRILVIEHNPLNPMTRWVVAHCPFDDDAILLPPREVKQYCAAAGLLSTRRDYIVFFPKSLSGLRGLEPKLGWLPAGAQYALTAWRA